MHKSVPRIIDESPLSRRVSLRSEPSGLLVLNESLSKLDLENPIFRTTSSDLQRHYDDQEQKPLGQVHIEGDARKGEGPE